MKLEKRYYEKIKSNSMRYHYLFLRSINKLEIIRKYGALGKLALKQQEDKTHKWAFILPPYYFSFRDDHIEFLNQKIEFKIQDPKMYIKRVEWSEKQFVFVLAPKKNAQVKRYTKDEIDVYAQAMGVTE